MSKPFTISRATRRRVNRITKDLRRQAKQKARDVPLNKLYVASPKMTRDLHARAPVWAKATLADAIQHARDLLDSDPTEDRHLVVQVVCVVKRQQVPAVVEKV